MLTTFLSRADVSRNILAQHLLRELREAFAANAPGPAGVSVKLEAPLAPASTVMRSATLPGVPAWVVTVRTEWPNQPPRSVLQLHDLTTGKLLALMDGAHLATLRTSLVGALATDVLARETAADVAVLGSGTMVSSALKALRLVRTIDRVWLHQPEAAANFELAMKLQTSLSLAVRAVDSAQDAVRDADVVLLTGGVALPAERLRPGTHVTVLSADGFEHPPLTGPLLSSARRVVDGRTPQLGWGIDFQAELGEVLRGSAPGRSSRDEVTVFASVCPPFLDLVAAQHVYAGAQRDETLTRLDLEA